MDINKKLDNSFNSSLSSENEENEESFGIYNKKVEHKNIINSEHSNYSDENDDLDEYENIDSEKNEDVIDYDISNCAFNIDTLACTLVDTKEIKKNKLNTQIFDDKIVYVEDPNEKISSEYMTFYEAVRILFDRSVQLRDGANTFIVTNYKILSPFQLAILELKKNVLPFIVKRPINNKKWEIFEVSELKLDLIEDRLNEAFKYDNYSILNNEIENEVKNILIQSS